MHTSKMKAARMIACYGASVKQVARIIGTRRAKRVLTSFHQPRIDWRWRVYPTHDLVMS